jgi:hypothetical protein
MAKNVLIPLDLLGRIIALLEYWDISRYDRTVRDDYECVLSELSVKIQKLELRHAYTKIIRAKDEDARLAARIEYLRQRHYISKGG